MTITKRQKFISKQKIENFSDKIIFELYRRLADKNGTDNNQSADTGGTGNDMF